jgi:hypothetical protein
MIEHFLPFGRHRGEPPAAVDSGYLSWFLRTCKLSSGLRRAIRDTLVARGVPVPPPPPPKPPPVCRHCDGVTLTLSWQQLGGKGGRTIRADCQRCGRFVTFVAQTDANVAEADARAKRMRQRTFFNDLCGCSGGRVMATDATVKLGSKTSGHCLGCHVPLQAAARWCVSCFRRGQRPCPTCISGGKLVPQYRRQKGKPPSICPTCGGTTVIFDVEQAMRAAHDGAGGAGMK